MTTQLNLRGRVGMKVERKIKKGILAGAEGEILRVYEDNRGEPYRKGLTLVFDDSKSEIHIFLGTSQVKTLQGILTDALGGRNDN